MLPGSTFTRNLSKNLIARTYIGLQHVQRYFESFFSDDDGFNFIQTISIIIDAY